MIVPLGASTVARTAPAARVRRKTDARSARVEATAEETDSGASSAVAAPLVLVAVDARERQPTASRPAASFLGALLTLKRGG